MDYPKLGWNAQAHDGPTRFICGFCGADVSVMHGFKAIGANGKAVAKIVICHGCSQPTYFDTKDRQVPGVPYGEHVEGITDDAVRELYEEARRASSASCYTATVLCCRKILMNVAVAHEAKQGLSFKEAVDHLVTKNLIPPRTKEWVDHIRSKANEATHEILPMSSADAQEILEFTGMLLKLVYEYPARMKAKLSGAAK